MIYDLIAKDIKDSTGPLSYSINVNKRVYTNKSKSCVSFNELTDINISYMSKDEVVIMKLEGLNDNQAAIISNAIHEATRQKY